MQKSLEDTFAALGDPTRLAVVGLLCRAPQRSGDIASALSIARPTMSRHLRVLRKAGLVEETSIEDDARARMYTLRHVRFRALRSWLDGVEAFWDEQLAGFAAHVDAKYGGKRSSEKNGDGSAEDGEEGPLHQGTRAGHPPVRTVGPYSACTLYQSS